MPDSTEAPRRKRTSGVCGAPPIKPNRRLTPLHQSGSAATAGGGIALDLPVGIFKEGFQFDALLIEGGSDGGNLRLQPQDSPTELVQKIIYHAGRSNIREVWVANRLVPSVGDGQTPAVSSHD
jgi:cytosine/adenosine deaminase-related metal-dependent hydrolase